MAKKDEPKSHHQPKAQHAEIETLQWQIAELTDALQRERADAMNVRRRSEEERAQMATFHKVRVVRDLLPVVDNLGRALKHTPEDLKHNDYVKGIQSVAKQFDQSLAKLGVERIRTVGEVFDPRFHEAVQMEEGEGTREVVSEELQAGYKLGGEVIRHAIVKVRMEA